MKTEFTLSRPETKALVYGIRIAVHTLGGEFSSDPYNITQDRRKYIEGYRASKAY